MVPKSSKWKASLHPRDTHGRFITIGVHVSLGFGLNGVVETIGGSEKRPNASVRLDSGRLATVPLDRIEVTPSESALRSPQLPTTTSVPTKTYGPPAPSTAESTISPAIDVLPVPTTPIRSKAQYTKEYERAQAEYKIANHEWFVAVKAGDKQREDATWPAKERTAKNLDVIEARYVPAINALPRKTYTDSYIGHGDYRTDMEKANPGYNPYKTTLRSVNCVNVAMTMELRARGYDVVAGAPLSVLNGESSDFALHNGWATPDGSERNFVTTWRHEMERTILDEWPDGARGWVTTRNTRGAGHIFNVRRENNDVLYYDGQSNDMVDEQSSVWKNLGINGISFTRCDDLLPQEFVLTYIDKKSLAERKRRDYPNAPPSAPAVPDNLAVVVGDRIVANGRVGTVTSVRGPSRIVVYTDNADGSRHSARIMRVRVLERTTPTAPVVLDHKTFIIGDTIAVNRRVGVVTHVRESSGTLTYTDSSDGSKHSARIDRVQLVERSVPPGTPVPPIHNAELAKLPRTDGTNTWFDDVGRVNPKIIPKHPAYESVPEEYSHNCLNVVQAMEMRARGYDVTAAPKTVSTQSVMRFALPHWRTKNGGERKITSFNTTSKTLTDIYDDAYKLQDLIEKTWPEGARGWVALQTGVGSGHILNVAVNDHKAYFYDGQNIEPNAHYQLMIAQHLWYVRVDDLEPTDDVIQALEYTKPSEPLPTVSYVHEGVDAIPHLSDTPSPADWKTQIADVNPNYQMLPGPAYDSNCVNVVNAAEMRMRGYDVSASASGQTNVHTARSAIKNAWIRPDGMFPSFQAVNLPGRGTSSAYPDMESVIGSWPDGARGWVHILVDHQYSGHVFNVTKVDGQIRYYDAQNGVTDTSYLIKGSNPRATSAEVVRVDDLEPTDGVLQFLEHDGKSLLPTSSPISLPVDGAPDTGMTPSEASKILGIELPIGLDPSKIDIVYDPVTKKAIGSVSLYPEKPWPSEKTYWHGYGGDGQPISGHTTSAEQAIANVRKAHTEGQHLYTGPVTDVIVPPHIVPEHASYVTDLSTGHHIGTVVSYPNDPVPNAKIYWQGYDVAGNPTGLLSDTQKEAQDNVTKSTYETKEFTDVPTVMALYDANHSPIGEVKFVSYPEGSGVGGWQGYNKFGVLIGEMEDTKEKAIDNVQSKALDIAQTKGVLGDTIITSTPLQTLKKDDLHADFDGKVFNPYTHKQIGYVDTPSHQYSSDHNYWQAYNMQDKPVGNARIGVDQAAGELASNVNKRGVHVYPEQLIVSKTRKALSPTGGHEIPNSGIVFHPWSGEELGYVEQITTPEGASEFQAYDLYGHPIGITTVGADDAAGNLVDIANKDDGELVPPASMINVDHHGTTLQWPIPHTSNPPVQPNPDIVRDVSYRNGLWSGTVEKNATMDPHHVVYQAFDRDHHPVGEPEYSQMDAAEHLVDMTDPTPGTVAVPLVPGDLHANFTKDMQPGLYSRRGPVQNPYTGLFIGKVHYDEDTGLYQALSLDSADQYGADSRIGEPQKSADAAADILLPIANSIDPIGLAQISSFSYTSGGKVHHDTVMDRRTGNHVGTIAQVAAESIPGADPTMVYWQALGSDGQPVGKPESDKKIAAGHFFDGTVRKEIPAPDPLNDPAAIHPHVGIDGSVTNVMNGKVFGTVVHVPTSSVPDAMASHVYYQAYDENDIPTGNAQYTPTSAAIKLFTKTPSDKQSQSTYTMAQYWALSSEMPEYFNDKITIRPKALLKPAVIGDTSHTVGEKRSQKLFSDYRNSIGIDVELQDIRDYTKATLEEDLYDTIKRTPELATWMHQPDEIMSDFHQPVPTESALKGEWNTWWGHERRVKKPGDLVNSGWTPGLQHAREFIDTVYIPKLRELYAKRNSSDHDSKMYFSALNWVVPSDGHYQISYAISDNPTILSDVTTRHVLEKLSELKSTSDDVWKMGNLGEEERAVVTMFSSLDMPEMPDESDSYVRQPPYPENLSFEDAKAEFNLRTAIKSIIDGWASTAGDQDYRAIAFQVAARNIFSTGDVTSLLNQPDGNINVQRSLRTSVENAPLYEAILRRMYEDTQKRLKEKNIKTLTLFRGMHRSRSGDLPWGEYPENYEGSSPQVNEDRHVNLNPLSSWTSEKAATTAFTGHRGKDSVLLTAKVPAERILSTSIWGLGCLGEREIIVIGSDGEINVQWLYYNTWPYKNA